MTLHNAIWTVGPKPERLQRPVWAPAPMPRLTAVRLPDSRAR